MKLYSEALTRECNLFSIKAWNIGEGEELKKWIGFGFFNHLFVSENGLVTLYYDIEEGERFHEVLNERLTEELFHEVCDNFFKLFERLESAKTNEEIFELSVKSWPALSIFDEISKYPELVNEFMISRLMKVRKTTERFSYDLEKKADTKEDLKDYIYYKGQLIEKPFDQFVKEEGIEIE